MLDRSFTAVLDVRSADALRAELIRFADQLGFQRVSALAVFDRGIGRSDFVVVHNAPDEWAERNHADAGRVDPVMQYIRAHSVPIVWDQKTYASRGLGDMWEEQARFGYRTGIAMALHLPGGRHFALGVERDQALPRSSAEVTRMVADLQLFAVHAQDAALRVLAPKMPTVDVTLTPREREALRWTMSGKTAWEVGSILGITERTAVLHLANAMHKLGVNSKHQAVLQALKLGLIE